MNMGNKILKWIPVIFYALAIYFFLQEQYLWSGGIIAAVGLLSIFLGTPGSELVVLVGFIPALIVFEQMLLLALVCIITAVIGVYDLTLLYIVSKEMKERKQVVTKDEWRAKFREKALLFRFLNRICKYV